MSDDIIKRLRDAIAEHPLSPIHGYAENIAALFDRLDAAERERDSKAAELANLQVAFSDWKVFHSTARLEAENERLREDAERLDSGCIRLVDRDDFGESVATVYAQVDLRAAIDAARREE